MSNLFRTFMGSGARPWLRNDGSERLFTLRLKGVENPLDPDPLWESTYGGGHSIIEGNSNSNSRRLKEALSAHRKLSPEWDDFGFPTEKMLVFSDVVMWLPKRIWSSSSREGGERLFMLSEKLKFRHREDFGDELYKKREPHYAIMPLKSLALDEVVFQFGLGVYLPHKEDQQTAHVKIFQTGKTPKTLPPWIFFEDQREIERPAALYAEQHFLLVGKTIAEAAIQSPYWLNKPQGYLMVDTHREPNRIYGDDQFIESGEITGSGDSTFCEFHGLDEQGETNDEHIKLLITRLANLSKSSDEKPQHIPVSNEATVPKPTEPTTPLHDNDFGETIINTSTEEQSNTSFLDGLTVVSGVDEPPRLRFRLAITGIILPRIDYPSIKYWVLHLDPKGMPADSDETSQWLLRGDRRHIEWCTVNSDKPDADPQWQSLDTQTNTLPFPDTNPLTLRAAVLGNKQHAILMLPQTLNYPLSHQESRLGRDPNNDIVLQLLNHDESIEWVRPTRRKQSMGHLDLSASHLSVHLEGQSLSVEQKSTSAPTHILYDQVITQTLEAKSFSKATLKPTQELIVGNYLLQYTKEVIEDEKV
ncbi:MAG: hypothetical protein KAG28_02795 [Cocleimonas sp.]|nr:hypothetical protein [Cocleimonas sp.]